MKNALPNTSSLADTVKITDIKVLQPKSGATLIKVETDAGQFGIGPCHGTGPFARAAIDHLEGPRLPHLGLIGKDPLAIQVHFHNMFYAYPQRGRGHGRAERDRHRPVGPGRQAAGPAGLPAAGRHLPRRDRALFPLRRR